MNIQQLQAICSSATPGPWEKRDDHGMWRVKSPKHSIAIDYIECDADFVAAFNPAFVAKLLDLWEALDHIAKLDPEFNSPEGYNEWGEADCFKQAQEHAKTALTALEQS